MKAAEAIRITTVRRGLLGMGPCSLCGGATKKDDRSCVNCQRQVCDACYDAGKSLCGTWICRELREKP